jgi:malate synthase
VAETLRALPHEPGNRFDEAAAVFRAVTLEEDFPTFLTITAYTRYLVEEREEIAA